MGNPFHSRFQDRYTPIIRVSVSMLKINDNAIYECGGFVSYFVSKNEDFPNAY